MLPLSGLLGRICNALLNGLLAFIIVFILGVIIGHFDGTIGALLEKYAPLIGLLVGLVSFFGGYGNRNNTVL